MLKRLARRRTAAWAAQAIAFLLVGCASAPPPQPQVAVWQPARDEWDVLRQENRDLKERVETLAASVEGLRAHLDAVEHPEKRREKIEKPAKSSKKAAPVSAREKSEGATVADSSHAGMHTYYEGLRLLEAGEFEKAIRSLRVFIENHPEHVYADRAQYLLVEANLRNKEFGLALMESKDFEARYPGSFRLPDILLQRAIAYENMGQREAAAAHLHRLVEQYPGEPSALDAAKRLAKLESVAEPQAPAAASPTEGAVPPGADEQATSPQR